MDYLKRFTEIINKDERHPYYQWTVDYAEKMRKLITGEDMESLMRQFDMREDKDLFKQRVRITQHITKSVAKNLMKPMKKVPRCNRSERIIVYEDQTRKDEFEKILLKFWGRRTMDDWMISRYIELANIDPNAYVVVEWKPFTTSEHASPYPFEVSSADVIMFEYDMNILKYLVVKLDETVTVDDVNHKKVKYTMYTPNEAIILDEVINPTFNSGLDGKFFTYKGEQHIFLHNKYFKLITPTPYNLKDVPAFPAGYERHLSKPNTYVSGIDDAEPILMKLVKATSELDLTMALHAFPQKLQYVKRCNNSECRQGSLPDGGLCGTCNGTGLSPHKSAQEVIMLELPRQKEDMLDLSGIIHYVSPSVELIQFQDKYVDSLSARCKQAVYNSEVFTRGEFTETATAKNLDYQNIYDALYPLSKDFVMKWEWLVGIIAKITDMEEGLIWGYFIPKDMQMKPTSELYNDLKTVSDAKADPFIKQGINDDIASYMYQDDSYELSKYKTRQRFFPFSGKSESEIVILVSTDLVTDFNKVLYANYGTILDELAMEVDGFYKLNPKKQWGYISDKVNGMLKTLTINDYQEPEEQDSDKLF